MHFYKYHGLGNDFVLTLDLDGAVEASPERAVRICDRHTGIGADGWMLIRKSDTCDIQMFLYNSDGSVAEMCGNGLRCFAKFVYDHGIVKKEQFTVETLAGIMRVRLTVRDGEAALVTANIGKASFERAAIPMAATCPLLQANCKLKPPQSPSTSSTSPAANRPAWRRDIRVWGSKSLVQIPPAVTCAPPKPWVPVTSSSQPLATAAACAHSAGVRESAARVSGPTPATRSNVCPTRLWSRPVNTSSNVRPGKRLRSVRRAASAACSQ